MKAVEDVGTPALRGTWYALGVSYAAMISLAIASNLLPVLLMTLRTSLASHAGQSLSNEQLGRIGAMIFAGSVAAMIIAGPIADRFGAKLIAIAGNLLVAAGLVLLGLANSYGQVLTAALILGLGGGILDLILSPIVSALQPHRRTSALNLLQSFYCLGAVGIILAHSFTLRMGMDWRALAWGLIAIPLVVAVLFMGAQLPGLIADGQQRQPLTQLCRYPIFWLIIAVSFLAGATELGLSQWLPAYAETTLAGNRGQAGLAFILFCLAMAAARMVGGIVGSRLGPVRLLLPCCALGVVTIVAGSLASWPSAILITCAGMGLAAGCLWPSTLALAADRFPRGGASMFAGLTILANLGGIVMPWAIGGLADLSTLRWGLGLVSLCPLLMLILLGLFSRRMAA